KKELKITLLADEGQKTCEKYGVWQEKSMYGRTFMGVVRTTFLIDPDGKIAHVFEKVKAEGHAEEVRQRLAELQKA
ncbi:MAG: redoxin domain-containing protein, partial [Spirochaetia bacterium]|nr:redoxin domain-containing protein [Spirochaetia bacterium]